MQITYAAMDALVAIDIISGLVNRRIAMNRGEKLDSDTIETYHFVHWDSAEFIDVLHSMCEPLCDIGYSHKSGRLGQVK